MLVIINIDVRCSLLALRMMHDFVLHRLARCRDFTLRRYDDAGEFQAGRVNHVVAVVMADAPGKQPETHVSFRVRRLSFKKRKM